MDDQDPLDIIDGMDTVQYSDEEADVEHEYDDEELPTEVYRSSSFRPSRRCSIDEY